MENLNNQIHFRNICSLLNHVNDTISHMSFDDYMSDENLRMDIFRHLSLIGIEAFNIRGTHCPEEVNILKSFMKADFLNGFGREHYAVYNFLHRDVSFLCDKLQPMMQNRIMPDHAGQQVRWTA